MNAAPSNSKSVHIRLLIFGLALAAFLAFIPKPNFRSLSQPWLPSTFNPGSAGYMATYQTLLELNWPVERWQAPLSLLHDSGQVWIFSRTNRGQETAVSDEECVLLRKWVSNGNTAIFLGPLGDWDDSRTLLHSFGIYTIETDRINLSPLAFGNAVGQREVVVPPTHENPIQLPLSVPEGDSPLVGPYPADSHKLWADADNVYGIDLAVGKGKVIWLSSAKMLSRAWLPKGENLEAMTALMKLDGQAPRKIYFDELHNGFNQTPNFSLLISDPGVAFAAILAVLGLLALLSSSLTRFGQILTPDPIAQPASSSEELVQSIALLYYKSRLREDVLKQLYADTKHLVCKKLHLPESSPGLLIHARLLEACPTAPSWKKLFARFEPSEYSPGLPPTGWIRVAQQLITIQLLLP